MDKEVKNYFNDMGKLIEKLKPFMAIIFLVVAVVGVVNLVKYTQLQPQIKENCGWEDEGVKCYCEKSEYYAKKEFYEDREQSEDKINDLLDSMNLNGS